MGDRFNFHWQNLNEKPAGRTGLALRHGRAWLRVLGIGFNWQWSFLQRQHVGISLRATQAEEIGFRFSIGVPILFSLYLTVWGGWFTRLSRWLLMVSSAGCDERELSLRFHDAAVWWYVWCDTDSWSSDTPRYRSGSFHPIDFVLGQRKYSERTLTVADTLIAMPEAYYSATVTLLEATWKRPRWPFALRLQRAKVEIPEGVPFPGKSENSWDCGQDAIFGMTCNASTIEGAVAAVVESVLRSRRRYGGSVNWMPAETRGDTAPAVPIRGDQ